MSRGDQGKWAEAQVQAWLAARSNGNLTFASHRFPDARAARGALAAQPSDQLVVSKSRVTFLEVKETKNERRLPKSKLTQFGTLLKFYYAGADVVVLVYRSAVDNWVYLTCDELFDDEECPPSFPLSGLRVFPTAEAALLEIFK